MPPIAATFEIVPKPDLSPGDRMALGNAMRLWLSHHAKHGAGLGKNHEGGLEDLLAGRRVPTLFKRRLAQIRESRGRAGLKLTVHKPSIRQELIKVGDDPARRTIRLELFYVHDDRTKLVEIVRRWVPPELVADVQVNSRSWADSTTSG